MKRFKKVRGCKFRAERNETNDCAVIALSILGRMSYGDAHGFCKARGRTPGKGMFTGTFLDAIHDAGLVTESLYCPKQPSGSKYTPKTIGARLKKGYYLCISRGHFFSVVNGDVEDWSKDRKLHIRWVYKITKPKKVAL